MPQRQLRLGAFIMATGHHVAAWRHPGSQVDSGINIDHYIEVAQTAERGLFDQVFVADSPGLWHKGDDESLSRQGRVSHFEPVTLWAALSAVTKHIGFVATASIRELERAVLSGAAPGGSFSMTRPSGRIPVIALTASADREKCFAAGMNGYLTKPFAIEDVTEAIRGFLT